MKKTAQPTPLAAISKLLYTATVRNNETGNVEIHAFVSEAKRNWFVDTLNRIAAGDFVIESNQTEVDEEVDFRR